MPDRDLQDSVSSLYSSRQLWRPSVGKCLHLVWRAWYGAHGDGSDRVLGHVVHSLTYFVGGCAYGAVRHRVQVTVMLYLLHTYHHGNRLQCSIAALPDTRRRKFTKSWPYSENMGCRLKAVHLPRIGLRALGATSYALARHRQRASTAAQEHFGLFQQP